MKSKLEVRLTRQLASKGQKDAAGLARALLIERNHINSDGTLTKQGAERQALGASGRAKDRAAKRSGRSVEDYKYNSRTNRATLKK
jgi:hypothetical protein